MSLKIFETSSPELPFVTPLPGGLGPADKFEISVALQADSSLDVTFKANDDETLDSRVPLHLSVALDGIKCKSGDRNAWGESEVKHEVPMEPGVVLLTIELDESGYRIEVNGKLMTSFSYIYPPLVSTFLEIVSNGAANVRCVSYTKQQEWMNVTAGRPLPLMTLKCGTDGSNDIYLGRGLKNNSMMMVCVNPAKNAATLGCNGREVPMQYYEVLQDNRYYGWKKLGEDKEIPNRAVEGGFDENGEVLYIGRVAHERHLIPGTIYKTHSILSIPFRGKEMKFSSRFEVLTVLTPKEIIIKEKAEQLNLELEALEALDYIPNPEPFECRVCLDEFAEGAGVRLRECFHTFCKECLSGAVEYSDTSEVKCPYQDEDYSCDMLLQEREIRAVVSPELFQKHLAKSLREAESQMENTFHCLTENCDGWCTHDKKCGLFVCPICHAPNCLNCIVIHEGTCKEYQDRLQHDREMKEKREKEAQTQQQLQEMLRRGEAMVCPSPSCGAIISKTQGCDGMNCSMCKIAICWATKGARWGPRGNGDTSGGCRCNVNGQRCSPNCQNCH